jgi:Argonaute linker 1 domain
MGANKLYLIFGRQPISASTDREKLDKTTMLDTLRGYYTSIWPGLKGILLSVNATTGAFFHPETDVSVFIWEMRSVLHKSDFEIKSMLRCAIVWLNFPKKHASIQIIAQIDIREQERSGLKKEGAMTNYSSAITTILGR